MSKPDIFEFFYELSEADRKSGIYFYASHATHEAVQKELNELGLTYAAVDKEGLSDVLYIKETDRDDKDDYAVTASIGKQCSRLIMQGIKPSLLIIDADNLKALIPSSGDRKFNYLTVAGHELTVIRMDAQVRVCLVYGNELVNPIINN